MQNNKGKRLEGRKDVSAGAQLRKGGWEARKEGGIQERGTDRGQNGEVVVHLGLGLFCFKMRGKTERREGEKREKIHPQYISQMMSLHK